MKARTILLCLIPLIIGTAGAEPLAKKAGRNALVFTEQLLPTDDSGGIVSPGNASGQMAELISKTTLLLEENGSGWDKVARAHVYVTSSEVEREVRGITGPTFSHFPATWVVTPLPHPDALVALDVIATTTGKKAGSPAAAILPSGTRYFVSGQAARDKDLAAATRGTMEQLQGTLQQYGRTLADSVQIKSFVQPMSDVATARREIESFFEEGKTPPLVFVEWESTLPIEIELVAFGGSAKENAEPVEFLTPEGMKASPVFCRVVRVNDGPLVFVSGINGDPASSPADQVKAIFAEMKSGLEAKSSDLRHLVKATYYVANPEVSGALNELRPDYYDPARPPAASKAMVAGGGQGSDITVDMIAVSKE
jgi:enamine deaminase RidA (YjgF/YER057c/UK114 family)